MLCFSVFARLLAAAAIAIRERGRRGDSVSPAFVRQPNPKQSRALMLALLCAVAGGASAANVNGEARRVENNREKLLQIHAPARPKFAATIRDLERSGERPYIVDAYRDPRTQAGLRDAGFSRVAWSFHNARTKTGRPDSLAMDVVDAHYFWKTSNDFFLMQAAAAQGHNLKTGIRWGLPEADRQRIELLLAVRDWKANYRAGWDPGHVEITGLTLAQARAGQRPSVASPAPPSAYRALHKAAP